MRSECLPFRQIPHTTPLFTDFLSYSSQVQQFYPRSPYFNQWFKEEAGAGRYDNQRREQVCAILERQSRARGASSATMQNIARLRNGAFAAVTGQQVGLFGGPAFSIYKALTAVKLADAATRGGIDCVPIFWLATEDHDLAEVNHTSLPGPDGLLQTLTATGEGIQDAPVGTLTFGGEIESLVKTAGDLLGDSDALAALRDSYRAGETFATAFAKFFTRIFADYGVILLDASDPELHRIAAPIYRAAIERAPELDEALLIRGRELDSAGYHQQVKVASSTLLFNLRNGARVSVQRSENDDSTFSIEDGRISRDDLLQQISRAPQNFSPKALLRPVVQDYLLPTLAYVGGPAEVAYFAQAGVVYKALLGKVTPIVPRFSATLIEQKPQAILSHFELAFSDVLSGTIREKLAARALPAELQTAFDTAKLSLDNSLQSIRAALTRLDKTLVDAADNTASKMKYQLENLGEKAARAELRQNEVLDRKAAYLGNALYPNKTLQERELPGVYFLARYGTDLLRGLYDCIHPDCLDHQVISL